MADGLCRMCASLGNAPGQMGNGGADFFRIEDFINQLAVVVPASLKDGSTGKQCLAGLAVDCQGMRLQFDGHVGDVPDMVLLQLQIAGLLATFDKGQQRRAELDDTFHRRHGLGVHCAEAVGWNRQTGALDVAGLRRFWRIGTQWIARVRS